jgi:hypothetical protein
MAGRERVIKGLECCTKKVCIYESTKKECPYWKLCGNHEGAFEDCTTALAKDALALLKEQEPIAPIQGADDQDEDIFCCGSCGAIVGETFLGPPGECEVRDNYCSECGRAVKWE